MVVINQHMLQQFLNMNMLHCRIWEVPRLYFHLFISTQMWYLHANHMPKFNMEMKSNTQGCKQESFSRGPTLEVPVPNSSFLGTIGVGFSRPEILGAALSCRRSGSMSMRTSDLTAADSSAQLLGIPWVSLGFLGISSEISLQEKVAWFPITTIMLVYCCAHFKVSHAMKHISATTRQFRFFLGMYSVAPDVWGMYQFRSMCFSCQALLNYTL